MQDQKMDICTQEIHQDLKISSKALERITISDLIQYIECKKQGFKNLIFNSDIINPHVKILKNGPCRSETKIIRSPSGDQSG